jgi:hypothetical protein
VELKWMFIPSKIKIKALFISFSERNEHPCLRHMYLIELLLKCCLAYSNRTPHSFLSPLNVQGTPYLSVNCPYIPKGILVSSMKDSLLDPADSLSKTVFNSSYDPPIMNIPTVFRCACIGMPVCCGKSYGSAF